MQTQEIITVNDAIEAAISGQKIYAGGKCGGLEIYVGAWDKEGKEFYIETYYIENGYKTLVNVHFTDLLGARLTLYGTYKMEHE